MSQSVSEMSPPRRVAAAFTFAISVVIVVFAQRDLAGRSDKEVRGSKWLWRVVCLNALGALGYLRWGRKTA